MMPSKNPWPTDLDLAQQLASLPTATTPRGGRHHYCRQPIGQVYRNTAGKLAPGVDTRADGGYVLVPPSVVNDKQYVWAPGDSLLDISRDQLPEPPAEILSALQGNTNSPSIRTSQPVESNSIPAGQRNAFLTSVDGHMQRAGMSPEARRQALLAENEKRCKPPLPQGEVERIVKSVSRYEPDQTTVAVIEQHAAQDAAAANTGLVDPGPLPPELLYVPGFVNCFTEYNLSVSAYRDRVLSFLPALATQSFLCSRKVCDAAGNRPSVYLAAVANSGAGKDAGLKTMQELLFAVGQSDCIGNAIASAEGLEDAMQTKPAFIAILDELGGLLNAIKSGREPRYEAIMNTLLKLYSSASGIYTMRLKAGQASSYIDQPALVIYGASTPTETFGSLTPRMLTNGFFSRLLIVEAGRRGRGQEPAVRELPTAILDVAQYWAAFTPGEQRANLSQWHPVPRIIDLTPDAVDVFRQFRDAMDAAYEAAEAEQDEAGMALIARCHEKARRLAILYACSESHLSPLIGLDAAKWSTQFVDHLTRRMLFIASANVAESEFDARCNRMLDVLRKWQAVNGSTLMPLWRVNRKLKGWTPREFEEVSRALQSRGQVVHETVTTAGRPGQGYRLT
jgi:hypothetical protein